MVTRSSILDWRIAWTEEPVGLQSIGLQRVRYNGSDLAHYCQMPLTVTIKSNYLNYLD